MGGVVVGSDGVSRCLWGDGSDLYRAYHDREWGFPTADDRLLFEKLSLEGFQAGLSWITILRKRPAFRAAFEGFDMERVASFGTADVERLAGDSTIVRHRGKIESTIGNARRAISLAEEFGSLAAYVWSYEPGRRRAPPTPPSTSPESEELSADLRRRGWIYVGPTTVYAFMQAMGLVNDHLEGCAAREEVAEARTMFVKPA